MFWCVPGDIAGFLSVKVGFGIGMVEIVVRRKIPKHRNTLRECVVSKKEVICLLALSIKERVVVIPLEAFHHITRVAAPLINLAVGSHGVHQMRSAVLDSDSVSMVMPHVREEIDSISIIFYSCVIYDTKRMELIAKCPLANDKLRSICSVEAINAVGPCDTVLKLQAGFCIIPILEKANFGNDVARNSF